MNKNIIKNFARQVKGIFTQAYKETIDPIDLVAGLPGAKWFSDKNLHLQKIFIETVQQHLSSISTETGLISQKQAEQFVREGMQAIYNERHDTYSAQHLHNLPSLIVGTALIEAQSMSRALKESVILAYSEAKGVDSEKAEIYNARQENKERQQRPGKVDRLRHPKPRDDEHRM